MLWAQQQQPFPQEQEPSPHPQPEAQLPPGWARIEAAGDENLYYYEGATEAEDKWSKTFPLA